MEAAHFLEYFMNLIEYFENVSLQFDFIKLLIFYLHRKFCFVPLFMHHPLLPCIISNANDILSKAAPGPQSRGEQTKISKIEFAPLGSSTIYAILLDQEFWL